MVAMLRDLRGVLLALPYEAIQSFQENNYNYNYNFTVTSAK